MATYLLKKSYQLKNLKKIDFHDLWEKHGIFTTMWIFGKPPKILFYDNHIKNLIFSLKKYQIKKRNLKKTITKIINQNLSKKLKYNHLLRVAINKKIISVSIRKKLTAKLNFNLKLANIKREKPEYKNLKYKKILSHLSKIDNTKFDCIVASGLIEYMPEDEKLLKESYRLLKNDGLLILNVTNIFGWSTCLNRFTHYFKKIDKFIAIANFIKKKVLIKLIPSSTTL